jgi:hypothetical protein
MTTFQEGQVLYARSIADFDCVFEFTILKRTAKFVTVLYRGQARRVGIRQWHDNVEYCYPLDSSVLLRADREVA